MKIYYSSKLASTIAVNIRNQCSNFKLINGKYYYSDSCMDFHSSKEVETGCTNRLNFKPSLITFGSAILYQLQRKDIKSDDRLESTTTLLFITWKFEGYKELSVLVQLLECDKTFRWSKFSSREYYRKYVNQLCTYTDPIKDIWLTRDGTVFMTRLELDFTQRDGMLNITISEGIKEDHVKIPELIDPRRRVS
jgi:hypothetical protein